MPWAPAATRRRRDQPPPSTRTGMRQEMSPAAASVASAGPSMLGGNPGAAPDLSATRSNASAVRAARRMTPVSGRVHMRTRRGYLQRASGNASMGIQARQKGPSLSRAYGVSCRLALKEVALRRQSPAIRPMEPGGSSWVPAPRRQGAPGTRHGHYQARKVPPVSTINDLVPPPIRTTRVVNGVSRCFVRIRAAPASSVLAAARARRRGGLVPGAAVARRRVSAWGLNDRRPARATCAAARAGGRAVRAGLGGGYPGPPGVTGPGP